MGTMNITITDSNIADDSDPDGQTGRQLYWQQNRFLLLDHKHVTVCLLSAQLQQHVIILRLLAHL